MAFDTRTRAEIRDSLLASWAARYAAANRTLDVTAGSDPYMFAESLAVELELFEQQSSALDKEILVDEATYTLERHGAVEGLDRKPATYALLAVTITGTPSAFVTFGNRTLNATDGTTYSVLSGGDPFTTLDGSGNSVVNATAQVAGTVGNKPVASILTWSSTPTGANATATVTTQTTLAVDAETDADYAQRILARIRERPASGNRSDWRDWATSVDGITDAVVYPLYHATYGAGTLGAVTVVAMGPAQGASATNTRLLSGGELTAIAGYIEGTSDIHGVATTTGVQLRPATMKAGDYQVINATYQTQNLEVALTFAAAYAPPWTYNPSFTVVSGTSSSVVVSGDLSAMAGLDALISVGSAARGGYVRTTIGSAVFSGGPDTTAIAVNLPTSPSVGTVVIPAPPNWDLIQAAIFNYFDALGPGDTTPTAYRWPTEEVRLRSKLYKSAIEAALVQTTDPNGVVIAGVPGVLAASVTTPGSDTQPAALTTLTLGDLIVHT